MQGQYFGQLKLLMEEKLSFHYQQQPIRTFKDDDNLVRTKIENVFGKNQLTVYDGNTDNVAYNFSIYEDSTKKREYNITYSFASKMGSREWNYTDVTMDQWNKFLTTLRMLTVALEASIQQPLVKFRDYTFLPPETYPFRTYIITKDRKDMLSISTCNRIVHNFDNELVIPYSPNIEEIIRRFVSEVSTTIDNWINQPSFDA